MKTPSQLIVHAACRHCLQGLYRHGESLLVSVSGIFTKQVIENHWTWKLRRRSKSAQALIERAAQRHKSGMEQCPIQFAARTGSIDISAQLRSHALARSKQFV